MISPSENRLKPYWQEDLGRRLESEDSFLEPGGSFFDPLDKSGDISRGIFTDRESIEQALEAFYRCLETADLGLKRTNALRKAAGLPPV